MQLFVCIVTGCGVTTESVLLPQYRLNIFSNLTLAKDNDAERMIVEC